jgi:hypothetical protein
MEKLLQVSYFYLLLTYLFVAKAAVQMKVIYTLSSISSCSIEEVAESVSHLMPPTKGKLTRSQISTK